MNTLAAVRLAERVIIAHTKRPSRQFMLAALFGRARRGEPDALREAGEIVLAVANFFGHGNANLTPEEFGVVAALHRAATRMMNGERPHVAPHLVKR